MPSTPSLSAILDISIASLVLFEPVPTITGIFSFATSKAQFIAIIFSSLVIVELSPVVPQTIKASTLLSIWNCKNFLNSEILTPFSSNGVGTAEPTPLNKIFFINKILSINKIKFFFYKYIYKK